MSSVQPAAALPVYLSAAHCCACTVVCHHIGPMQLCLRHCTTGPTANHFTIAVRRTA